MQVPFIGTRPVHGLMVLDAADSTVGGMLSLNVNVSPSRSCALVMNCGAGTMQEDHTRSLLKSQGSSRSCRQDTALGVHYGRNVVVAWKRSPVAVPGRDRRFRQSHPTVSCSPCHVHHKSVGGRLLKTRPWPATRKRYNLSHPRLHHTVGSQVYLLVSRPPPVMTHEHLIAMSVMVHGAASSYTPYTYGTPTLATRALSRNWGRTTGARTMHAKPKHFSAPPLAPIMTA